MAAQILIGEFGTKAYRCGICQEPYTWTVERLGDAAITWACAMHLHPVCIGMQREFEKTQLTVTFYSSAGGSGSA